MITTHDIVNKAQELGIVPRLFNTQDVEKIAEKLHITTGSYVEEVDGKQYHRTTLNLGESLMVIDWLKANKVEWATEL